MDVCPLRERAAISMPQLACDHRRWLAIVGKERRHRVSHGVWVDAGWQAGPFHQRAECRARCGSREG
jgi:hypothetical protein